MDAMPDAVVMTGGRGLIRLVNIQAEQVFGYRRDELLGRPVELLLPERYRARHVADREGYMAAPRVRPMGAGLELYGRRRDGSEVPVEISLSPGLLHGEPVIISTVRDISSRKQAEAERAALVRQQQALQAFTDAALAHLSPEELLADLLRRVRDTLAVDTVVVLLLDASGEQLRARAALGLEGEVDQRVRVPVGQGFAGRVAAEQRMVAVADIEQVEGVSPVLRARGVRSLLGVPLLVEGRLLGVLHVGSLLRRTFTAGEANLLQLVADRVALALDRSRLYEESQEAIRLRNEFLSAISHDLGNPVAAIRMESRLLQAAAAEGTPSEDLHEGLRQIEQAADRMWKQVEELLDLARLQVGRPLELSWQPMDLVEAVRTMVAAQQATTDQHRLRLELGEPALPGEWDRNRLERVLSNVLGNAIKYSPQGGEIVVQVGRADAPQGAGRWAVVEVRDAGIGIPAADLPHIFERFHRASNVVGRFAGTGIGLAGAKQVLDLHGGELLVESSEGVGTTVTVRLPLDERDAAGAGGSLRPSVAGAP